MSKYERNDRRRCAVSVVWWMVLHTASLGDLSTDALVRTYQPTQQNNIVYITRRTKAHSDDPVVGRIVAP